ncbi:hypothetical protein [Streptomyces sp. NBRC 110611]|uniref:hypothetical protein n=1 Tax=Streptomyces sp. NBRC 110611 TaxID=1621259 RepID=UPI0008323A2D|nr:hypothetical protein [Streptomyces sp. NBRC 110611]
MRRRTLLAGAALGSGALLAGCAEEDRPGRDESSTAAVRLRERAARDSTALLARYDATLAAHPALAERLRPLRSEVAAHARAFTDDATPSAGGTPSREPVHNAGAPSVPAEERAARSALADAERRIADTRTRELLAAPPEVARLLASVAASGAAHAYLLTEPAE